MSGVDAARRSWRRRATAGALGLLAGLLAVTGAACGDDDEDTASSSDERLTATTADHQTVTVSAVDYAFEDLPSSVPAGTTLGLVNHSEAEAHELVAFRLPADETRSAEDLAALPPEEQGALFGDAEPAAVLMAPPGEEATAVVGDGTLTQPGRYLILCSIPTGADPDELMAAAAASTGGPPDVAGGPPHLAHGMIADLTVE